MRNALKTLIISLGTYFVLKEIELNFSLGWGWLLLLALLFAALGATTDFFTPLLCIGSSGFVLFLSNGAEQIISMETGFFQYFMLIGCSFIVTNILVDVATNGGIKVRSLIFWGIGMAVIAISLLLPQWTGYTVSWTQSDVPRGISFIIIFFCQILFCQNSNNEENDEEE